MRRPERVPERTARRRGRGFSLLEVLAAVAVLAIVYTVLATSAMQGLANEGESYRRIQASLLADRTLAALEAGLAQGAPPLGVDEQEEGDYSIAVETRALDLGAFAMATQERPGIRAKSPTGGETSSNEAAFQLLTVPRDASAPPLVEIQVAIRWLEGNTEQMVTRTTFAYDVRVVGPVVEALAGQQAATDATAAEDGGDEAQEPGAFPPPAPDEGEGEE
jgi:prepilin-type N-terminal cleavage/methylation domain-containing protein